MHKNIQRGLLMLILGAMIGGLVLSSAVSAQPGVTYYIQADTVLGSKNIAANLICTQNNVFKQNQQIVWRARIYERATGNEVKDPAAVPAGLTVQVIMTTLDGKAVTFPTKDGKDTSLMVLGPHPPQPKEGQKQVFYWTAALELGPATPPGQYKWNIQIKDKGGKVVGEFAPIGQDIPTGLLTVTPP